MITWFSGVLQRVVRSGIGKLVLMLTVGAWCADGLAQGFSSQDREALQALARQIDAPQVDSLLAQVHFPPPDFAQGPAKGYAQWPVLRKIEAAFGSAITTAGAPAGDDFLRSFSRLVAAQRANSIRYEKALAGYFPEPSDTPVRFEARSLKYDVRKAQAPQAVGAKLRTILLTLERYASGVPGGMQALMAACCQLDQERAYEILRTAASDEAALLETLARSKIPPAMQEKLRRMMLHMHARSNAFRYEPAFKPYLQPEDPITPGNASPWTPPVGPPGGAVAATREEEQRFQDAIHALADQAAKEHGGTGGGGAGGGGNAPRYESVLRSVEGRPMTARADTFTFRTLSGRGGGVDGSGGGRASIMRGNRGFGGVVFGNDVSAPGLPKLRSYQWVPERPQATSGRFEFVFTDESVGYSKAFTQTMAALALDIVHEGCGPSVGPVNGAGQGLGLAGVDQSSRVSMLPRLEGDRVIRQKLNSFVVFPCIDGTSLGHASVAADALPFMSKKEWFVQRLADTGAPEATQRRAEEWLSTPKGFYKITDAPMQIVRSSDGFLHAVRAHAPKFSESHRRQALLTFQSFTRGNADPEFKTAFYELVPALIRAHGAYRELNEFATAYGIVRYANSQRAAFQGPRPTKAPVGRSATWVLSEDDGAIRLLSDADVASALRTFNEQILRQSIAGVGKLDPPSPVARAAMELRERRERMLMTALAQRTLALSSSRENAASRDARTKAAESLENKLLEEHSAMRSAMKAFEEALDGAAPAVPNARFKQLGKELQELREARSRLQSDHLTASSIDKRLESATPEVKAKVDALIRQQEAREARYLGAGMSPETWRKAMERHREVEEAIDSLLPTPELKEIEASMTSTNVAMRRAAEEMDSLARGPLKAKMGSLELQSGSVWAWRVSVDGLLVRRQTRNESEIDASRERPSR